MNGPRRSKRTPVPSTKYPAKNYNLLSSVLYPQVRTRKPSKSIQARANSIEKLLNHSCNDCKKIKYELEELRKELNECKKVLEKNVATPITPRIYKREKIKALPGDDKIFWMGKSIVNQNGYYRSTVPGWIQSNPKRFTKKHEPNMNNNTLNSLITSINGERGLLKRRNMTVANMKNNRFTNIHKGIKELIGSEK